MVSIALDLAHLRIDCRRRRRRDLVNDNIARSKSRGRSQEKGGGSGSEFHLDSFLKDNVYSIWPLVAGKRKIDRFDDREWFVATRRRTEGTFFVEACRHRERKLEITRSSSVAKILQGSFLWLKGKHGFLRSRRYTMQYYFSLLMRRQNTLSQINVSYSCLHDVVTAEPLIFLATDRALNRTIPTGTNYYADALPAGGCGNSLLNISKIYDGIHHV